MVLLILTVDYPYHPLHVSLHTALKKDRETFKKGLKKDGLEKWLTWLRGAVPKSAREQKSPIVPKG